MTISRKIAAITESATLAISARAQKMKSEGISVIDFGVGEPDFDTPEPIKQAAIEALARGATKYTAAAGAMALRKAVAEKFRKDNGLDYSPEEILISCGAKHSLFNMIATLVDDGDEVLIPSPYWVSYPEQVRSVGGIPVIVPTRFEESFRLRAEPIEKAITRKTKLLILNSPSNPTGAVLSEKDLQEIAELLLGTNVFILSDEIYEKLVYAGARHHSIAAVERRLKPRTVVVNGVSKAYAMTGWRIGFAAGPKDIIAAAVRFQSHATSAPATMAQEAAAFALLADQSSVGKMAAEFDKRRKRIVRMLRAIPGFECTEPLGAFYVFPRVSSFFGKVLGKTRVKDSTSFAAAALEEARLAIVPGEAFGADEFVRFSYATSIENIEEGMRRLEKWLTPR